MQRNMELVRTILLAVERDEDCSEFEGFQNIEVRYHVAIMAQAGLVEAIDVTTMDDAHPQAIVKGLTWFGHEFIDASRNQSIWEQGKAIVEKAGGGAFSVWLSVLTDLVKKSVGV